MSNGHSPQPLSEEILANSVTRRETEVLKPQDGIVRVMIGAWNAGTSTIFQELPDLPPFWTFLRDRILVSTVTVESRWAQAVGIAVMKTVTREWDVSGEVPTTRLQKARRRVKQLLSNSQRSALVTDYFLRDNGGWAEIVRPTAQPTGVIGLNYLTSSRCMPTGDPNIPCVYWDRLGHPHELKDYQVMRFVDMADGANPYGVGLCAARRAYNDIRQTAAVQRFRLEKITGNNPKSLFFLTGITDKQLKGILLDHKEKQEADNVMAYGGVLIAALMQREGITSVEIPIAALPDGFDLKTEIQMMSTAYANALPGVTYLDLMPMTGQRAGSSAQSQVVDDQEASKASHITAFTECFNDDDLYKIMPEGVTFFFKGNDLVDKERMAKVTLAFSQAAALLVSQCQIAPQIVAQWLMDNDILPPDNNPNAYNTLEESESASGEGNSEGQGMIVKPQPVAPTAPFGAKPKPVATQPSATKMKSIADSIRALSREGAHITDARLEQLIVDTLAEELVQTKEVEAEDEVKTVDALRFAMESYALGQKSMQQPMQALVPSSGPNFHLDNVRMEMPDEMLTALKEMQNPNVTVHVPAPIVNVTTPDVRVNVPQQLAPQVSVNVPSQPAPVINVTVPQVEDETKTIEVASRDANGFMEKLVQRTRRTFKR